MSESNSKDKVAQDQEDSGAEHVSAEQESEVAETTNAFVGHACRVVLHSDEYFHEDKSASLRLGLINFAIFLGTTFLYQFFVQVTRLSSWSFKFAHVTRSEERRVGKESRIRGWTGQHIYRQKRKT